MADQTLIPPFLAPSQLVEDALASAVRQRLLDWGSKSPVEQIAVLALLAWAKERDAALPRRPQGAIGLPDGATPGQDADRAPGGRLARKARR